MKIPLTCPAGSTKEVRTGNWRDGHYPAFDHEICIACGQCQTLCPEGICFKTAEKNSKGVNFYEADLDYCKGCGICAAVCPVKAITMREEKK